MAKSRCYLLGAGFSAPMGYPVGSKLNNLLLKCKGEDFAFDTSGVLAVTKDGKKPDFGYPTSYDINFEFGLALIALFHSRKGYFDYEEFYDFMLDHAKSDAEVGKLAEPYLDQFGDVGQLIFGLKSIYQQVVSFYINDKDGKKWYDGEPYMTGQIFPGYSGFLNYFKKSSKDFDLINIHTLNHDMFFERLNNSEWLEGDLCDGFVEAGSPFYGLLSIEGRTYHCRLPRYTGEYPTKFRLYKLHGSFDYGIYYKSDGGSHYVPEVYIKTRYGIGFGELLKEVMDQNGQPRYDNCWITYHSDFLTGTTSKIQRYKEPLLYTRLFKLFVANLKDADSLIIIGYGCKDLEVNRLILGNFDHQNKPSYIVDPYPSNAVKEFCKSIGAKLVVEQLENLKGTNF